MLELKNISFEVQEESEQREIIHNLDLTIEDHEFVVITGPNGGGKSTLAKLIAGIKTPTEGQIFFDGQEITGKSITERANMGISFAFQQPVRFKGIQVLDLLRLAAHELKRIEIATVLARASRLSVFDEPEAGIDLWSFQNLIQVFERMREKTKGSIVIISHQERILNIADRIVVIADGRITKTGRKEEILPEILGTASAVGSCEAYRRDK